MSRDDEARYGRACLLVLNVCPFTLREVINDYSLRHAGSLSLCDFLEKNKHSLFHLYAKKCCCKHLQQNRSIPMYKSQWDSLFMQNTSSCQKGKQIDCPCRFDCKPSITTNVMDVTLCCLVINNICPGVDVNHIKTIREIRNNLVHAESARLDLLTFNGYMNRVKTAICQLAKNVSTTLHTDTVKMIAELENRLMDPVELSELRKLIIDQKRLTDLEADVSNTVDDLNQTRQEVAQISIGVSEATEKVTQIEDQTQRELSQIRGTAAIQGQGIKELQEQLRPIHQESNEHRRQIDDHGRQIDDHGRHIDDHGRQIDDHGRQIDDHGRHIDDHGRQIDGHGRQIDDHCRQIDDHGRHIDDHGRHIDDHGRQIDGHSRQIDDHGRQIDDHGRHIDDHGRQIDDHGRQIDGHCRQIDYHGRQIDEHGRQIDEQAKQIAGIKQSISYGKVPPRQARQGQEIKGELQEQLRPIQQESNEQRRQISDHDRRINDHGRQIDDHGIQIDEQAKQIADIKQRIPYGKVPPRQDEDAGVRKMKERLMEINEKLTRFIQISPLQDTEEELPIELLYASVLICEDQKYVAKGSESSQEMEEFTGHWERRHDGTSDFDIGSYMYKYEMSCVSEVKVSDDSDSDRDFELFSSIYGWPRIREVTNPDDIFQKDGKYVRKIYMLGDAAHGKTTYCVWLLRKWCNAKRKERTGKKNFDKWEEELRKFDFVFLMKFCNVNDLNLVSVVEMICQDAFESDKGCHDAIRHVLSSDEYKSLIILDGLDELNSNSKNRMPRIDVSGSVTCFITMRPWVFPLLLKKPKHSDRVIEIRGLSETGMENIIENVLANHYKLKEETLKYTETKDRILKSLKNKSLKSFMQIPLLAVVCVQIWYEGKQVGDSITSFYAEMLNMLIERANEKQRIEIEHDKTENVELPQILSVYDHIENCSSVLLKLGKVAYEGLLSNETNLVFQKRKLEKEIGVKELQFALDVGLISQKEARSLTTKNVTVHFFHKSIQEFLAVIYIVTTIKEVDDSFCKHLSSVDVIMELSNVTMFICGMCPSLGRRISQCVVSVTNSDTEICEYRESPGLLGNNTVRELYKLQTSWYRELQARQTDSPVTFHVSDVYLFCSDIETVRVTRDVLSDHHVENIRSLYLFWVPTDRKRGVTNTELNEFLLNKQLTSSLDMVCINGETTDRSVSPICIPSLKTLYLRYVKINTDLDNHVCPPLLTDMTSLRVLGLGVVTLGDRGLGLSADMVHIEKVRLYRVDMSSIQCQQFVLSVLNIQHKFNVELCDTNIDDESMTKIRSSPDFNVTRDDVNEFGNYEFYFTRVWPPQVTQ